MTESTEEPRFRVRPGTEERARRDRWSAAVEVRVKHRKYGEAVVPYASGFAALLCAADVWRCDWMEIRDAEITEVGGRAEDAFRKELRKC